MCNADFNALSATTNLFVGRVLSVTPDHRTQFVGQDAVKRFFPDAASPMELMQRLRAAGPERQAEFARLQIEEEKRRTIETWGEFMTDKERQAFLNAEREPSQPNFDLDLKWYGRKVEVEVVESFSGDVKGVVFIKTGFGGGDCGVPFQVGEEYLIRAGEPRNGLYSVGICGKTAHVRYHQDTLASLRAWKQGKPRPRIVSGSLQDWTTRGNSHPRGGYPAMEGVEVALRADDVELKTTTDVDGSFRFEDVPRAKFLVEPHAPGYSPTGLAKERLQVDMTTNTCVSLFLTLQQLQASIEGRVLPQPGEELPKALWIEAIPADQSSRAPFDATARNEDGRFIIDQIEPGSFYVAINVENAPTGPHDTSAKSGRVWPYPATYYPGVADPTAAAVFEVQRGQTIDIGEWMLPTRLDEEAIPGRVLLPEGSPAPDARLILRRPGRNETISQIGPTASDGTFTAHLLDTIDYEIEAFARVGEVVYRAVVPLDAQRPAEIVIRLDRSQPAEADQRFLGYGWQ